MLVEPIRSTKHADGAPASPPVLATSRYRGLRRWGQRATRVGVPPLAVSAAVVATWYFVTYGVLAPRRRFLMPAPHAVLGTGFGDARNRAELLTALAASGRLALVGLTIAIAVGTFLAILMSQSSWIERSFYPWLVVLQTIPILALVPLIGFWFKYGFTSRVLVCVLIALFPIIANTLFGLTSTDPADEDLFRSYAAGRWQLLTKLKLPAALPSMLTGWRISAGLAVIGAIVGDFFFRQGEAGIGRLIDGYTANLQSEQLFAAVIASSLLGLSVFWLFGLLSRLIVGSRSGSSAGRSVSERGD